MGKPSWTVKVSLLNATANLTACLIAVRSGITAVATAYIISSYLIFPISQWAVNKLIKIDLLTYLRNFATPVLSSVIMVGAIIGFKGWLSDATEPKLLLIVGTIIGILVYALCVRILEPQLLTKVWEFVKSASNKQRAAKKPI